MVPAFVAYQYIEKSNSRPNGLSHLVSCSENGLIKCDLNCPRYSSEAFCRHTVAVALKNKTIRSFASALSQRNKKPTTSMPSQKIKRYVLRQKVPVQLRKPPLRSPEKLSSSTVINTAINISDISNTTVVYDLPKTNNLGIMTQFSSSFLQDILSNSLPGLPSSSSVKHH